jgi:hypothetical protein
MRKNLKKMLGVTFFGMTVLYLQATEVLAQGGAGIGITQPKVNGGVPAGASSQQAPALLSVVIRNAIALIFAFSSIIFVFIFFWGVVDWIWAGGDKEGIAKARQKITQSIIGLVLLSLSFAIMAIISQITSINLVGDIVLPSFMNR